MEKFIQPILSNSADGRLLIIGFDILLHLLL